jgi:calcium/calmodulin-dependent protein kinase I
MNSKKIKELYKIGRTIGRGSFAKVKQAKNRETGEQFAVKIFSKEKMSDEDKIALETEIEILMQIDHPNIVKLY